MIRHLLIFALVTFTINLTYGCLNGETKVLKSGMFIYEDHEGNVPQGHMFFIDETELNMELLKLDSLYQLTNDLDYLSDKGIVLILLRQYEKAIDLYLQIEKIEPHRYSTASNIGTVYELIGQDENALKWINRAIEIDSTSHNNSEWIHANILEAKIKGEQYYTSEHLIGIDFGTENVPTSTLTKDRLLRLHSALYFQLNERISFIKPKDQMIAQLLFDLGNIAFLLGNYSDALQDYGLAKKYGFEGQMIESRIQTSRQAKPLEPVKPSENYFMEIAGAIALLAFAAVIYKRTRNRRK